MFLVYLRFEFELLFYRNLLRILLIMAITKEKMVARVNNMKLNLVFEKKW